MKSIIMAVHHNDNSSLRAKIERRITDEAGSNRSTLGIVLVIVAVLLGIGLVYLSTKVSASMLSAATSHSTKSYR